MIRAQFQFVYNAFRIAASMARRSRRSASLYVCSRRSIRIPFTRDCIRPDHGTLHVKVEKNEGVTVTLYTLDADRAEPL